MAMKSKVFLPLAALIMLSGCLDQKTLLKKIVPQEDDTIARNFIELVKAGNYAEASEMLSPSIKKEETLTGLKALHDIFDHGNPVQIETIGCNISVNYLNSVKTKTTNLSYQIQFSDAWAAGSVIVERGNDKASILSARFEPISNSLGVLNAFSLVEKSALHYAILFFCIAAPFFILYALVLCIRSKLRKKWLWIIFILLGFFQLSFNWTTAQWKLQPLSFLLFGASVFKMGPYAPWILSCAFPIGAIVFLVRRKRLITKATESISSKEPS